jgi:hypothetical protein
MDPEDTEVDDTLPVMMGGLSSADALKSDQRQRGLVEAQMRSNMAALVSEVWNKARRSRQVR